MRIRNLSGVIVFALLLACALTAGAHRSILRVSRHGQQSSSGRPVAGQTATLMPDGNILLLGGDSVDGPSATAAIFNPVAGWTRPLKTHLQVPRAWHTATVLPDGTVLIIGGVGGDARPVGIPELFDPTTLSFRIVEQTTLLPRAHHTATLLTDGLLFVAGGTGEGGDTVATPELWDFRNSSAVSLNQAMLLPRYGHTATLQGDGSVLLWGGLLPNGLKIPDGEVFDPSTRAFRIQTALPTSSKETPKIAGTLPQDLANDVPVAAFVSLRFSEPVAIESLSKSSIGLSGPDGTIPGHATGAESGSLGFLIPDAQLLAATTYQVTITGVTTKTGSVLPTVTFSFTTSGAPIPTGVVGQGSLNNGDPQQSPFKNLPPLRAPHGVTAISGQVLRLDGQPLEGVILRVGEKATESDRTGRFLLPQIQGPRAVMIIDGRSTRERNTSYGVYEDGVDVTTGQTTVLQYTIWLTPIDKANAVKITARTAAETTITTPKIPGLEFHIPAGTTITDIDGKIAKEVSITPISLSQPPFPLPPGVNVPVYFTIQPGGGYISVAGTATQSGGWLVYPNTFHLTAGSPFDFWNYDADDKGWYIYGHGKVSPDGKKINPDSDVKIYELTGAMVAGSGLAPGSGPGLFCRWFSLFCGGEPVDLGTGLFVYDKVDLYLPDVVPLKLTRTYRPNDAASRAFGVGSSHNYDLFLVGDTSAYSYADLVFPDGARVHCPRTSTGTSAQTAVFQCNSMPGPFFGSTTLWNGSGWTMTLRDGTVYTFRDGFLAGRPQQAGLLSIADRNGNTVQISRDSNYNITQVTSPNGRWIQFTYDSNYRVTQAQDHSGRTVQYSYDTGGRLAQVTDPNSGVWKYTYDSSNNMKTITDPRNIVVLQNQYDAQNRVTVQTLADGVSTYQFSYNPSPCTTHCSGIWETDVTDPNGNVEQSLFNVAPLFPSGFATSGSGSKIVLAVGTAVTQTYSYQYQPGTNLISSITDPLGRVISYSYDALGNTVSTTRLAGTPDAATTTMTFEAKYSRMTGFTDPLGHTTTLDYDSNGNLIAITDPLGERSTRSYNSTGQLSTTTNPLGETFTFAYDGGDLTAVTDPLGRSVSFFVDSVGRRVSQTDASGGVTKFAFDHIGDLTSSTDPNGAITSFGYDSVGNLVSVTDSQNLSTPTTYSYDSSDRLALRQDALGNQQTYQYDGDGNLTKFTDRRGVISIFSYDALSRRTFSGFGQSGTGYESTINYTYDGASRLIQAIDSITGTFTRGYDSFNHLTSETTPQGTVTYTFDSDCRRTSFTSPGQTTINYTYDDAHRLEQISQGTTNVLFSYDGANRRSTATLPNGVVEAYKYDDASELTSITFSNGSNTIDNLVYGYDLNGRRTMMAGSYARTSIPSAISTVSYNSNNALTTWGTANLFYDLNGNMTSDGTHSYTWDARNHLAAIDSGTTASFTYDPFARRVGKNLTGANTTFVYDGANVVQELFGGGSAAYSLTGAVDERFQRIDSSGTREFLSDGQENTLALVDSSGTVQTQYSYEPYGSTTSSGIGSTNAFGFTGREMDATGLYYYRSRYYSPLLQRFVSEDPIGIRGGVNLYSYVKNDPVNHRDPFGLCPGCGGTAGNGGLPSAPGFGPQPPTTGFGPQPPGGFGSQPPTTSFGPQPPGGSAFGPPNGWCYAVCTAICDIVVSEAGPVGWWACLVGCNAACQEGSLQN